MQGIIVLHDIDAQLSNGVSAETVPRRRADAGMMGWNIAWMFLCRGINDLIVYDQPARPRPRTMFLHAAGAMTSTMRFGHDADRIEVEHDGIRGAFRFVDVDAEGDAGIVMAKTEADVVFVARGDCVADLDVAEFLRCHRRGRRPTTVVTVRPPARDGGLVLAGDRVIGLGADARWSDRWIDGGFYIVDRSSLEGLHRAGGLHAGLPLAALAERGDVSAYRHRGPWRSLAL